MDYMDQTSNSLLYENSIKALDKFYDNCVSFEKWCYTLDIGVLEEDHDIEDVDQYVDFITDFIVTYEDIYDDIDSYIPSKKEERRNNIVQFLRNHLQDFDSFLDLMFLWTEAWSDEDKEVFICAIEYDSSNWKYYKRRVTKSLYTVMSGCDTYGALDDKCVLSDIGNWIATEQGILDDWDDVKVRYFDCESYGRDRVLEGYFDFIFLNSSNCWCMIQNWC